MIPSAKPLQKRVHAAAGTQQVVVIAGSTINPYHSNKHVQIIPPPPALPAFPSWIFDQG